MFLHHLGDELGWHISVYCCNSAGTGWQKRLAALAQDLLNQFSEPMGLGGGGGWQGGGTRGSSGVGSGQALGGQTEGGRRARREGG